MHHQIKIVTRVDPPMSAAKIISIRECRILFLPFSNMPMFVCLPPVAACQCY